MGGGSFSLSSFTSYSKSLGRHYDACSGKVSGQRYTASRLKEILNPKGKNRECANSEEHPSTIPVILALDVTGSMGRACDETAASIGIIMKDLYSKFKDIEFCVMGIGDFEYDDAPLQVSQYESDVRIAESIDNLWLEKGGGGNHYESYSAAWYFGLYHTKLDAFDKQGRKGIIITMGDEPLNPDLPANRLKDYLDEKQVGEVKTSELYKKANEKFDIYHISINDSSSSYNTPGGRYENEVDESFRNVIGNHYKVSTINGLSKAIVDCIDDSITHENHQMVQDNEEGITW